MFVFIIAIIILVFLWAIFIYNMLVRLRNQVDEAWSDIDVQLKRRYDLIPNLMQSVKGYTSYESETLKNVTELREKAMSATTVANKGQAETSLSLGLGKLIAIAENYPDLKANNSFIDLQKNLSDIENQIQNARRYYNGTTRDYNTKIQSFPDKLIANMFNFNKREFFAVESDAEKEVPKVSF